MSEVLEVDCSQVDEARHIHSQYSNILNIHDSQVLYMGAGHRITKSGEWGCGSCVGDMGKRGWIRKENYYKEQMQCWRIIRSGRLYYTGKQGRARVYPRSVDHGCRELLAVKGYSGGMRNWP